MQNYSFNNSSSEKNPFDKRITHPRWFTIAVILLSLAFLSFIVTVFGLIAERQWNQSVMITFLVFTGIALIFALPGVYCLRKGMQPEFFIAMQPASIPKWWWFISVIPVAGGIVAYVLNKDINRTTAINMLCLGLLVTTLWPLAIAAIRVGTASSPQFTHIIFKDDFSNSTSKNWCSGTTYSYKNGEYNVKVVGNKDWAGANCILGNMLENCELEVDVKKLAGPASTACGLNFRFQNDENFYRFVVCPDNNTYAISKTWNGISYNLYNWTKSSNINGGNKINHLKVICTGSKIIVFANNNKLTEVVDESPILVGKIGITVLTNIKQPSDAEASFDNFMVLIP